VAGSVSQVLGAEVRPDPLLSIDQNGPVVIGRIVEVIRPAFEPTGTFPRGVTNRRLGILAPYGGIELMRVQMFQGPGSL